MCIKHFITVEPVIHFVKMQFLSEVLLRLRIWESAENVIKIITFHITGIFFAFIIIHFTRPWIQIWVYTCNMQYFISKLRYINLYEELMRISKMIVELTFVVSVMLITDIDLAHLYRCRRDQVVSLSFPCCIFALSVCLCVISLFCLLNSTYTCMSQ